MRFHEYPPRPWEEVLQGLPDGAVDLIGQMVRYQSDTRLSAALV